MKRKTIVFSVDALVYEDIAYLRTKPNFSKLMAHCSGVERVCTVYPSITYPAHVSIMTGCRPGKHGVFTNYTVNDDWSGTWQYVGKGLVQTEDIFAAAKRAGCSTASVFWPVTGNNENIDWLIDEYFFPIPGETPEEGFGKLGANAEALAVVRDNMNRWPSEYHERKGVLRKSHTFDDFINGCVCQLIRSHRPDLLLAHNCMIDSLRHRYGVFNAYVRQGLDMIDEWLGEIMLAMDDAGVAEDTNFVILSDHGQMDFQRRLKINTLLRRGGFVSVGENGKLQDWQAFSQANGMSATIFLKEPENAALYQRVFDYLCELRDSGEGGFSKIFTVDEVKERYGLYGNFSFIVESDGRTAFGDAYTEPLELPITLTDYRLGVATHGYMPEKGPQPVFLCNGPNFQKDVLLPAGSVVDEAPTLAAIWGETMPDAEGKCLRELLV